MITTITVTMTFEDKPDSKAPWGFEQLLEACDGDMDAFRVGAQELVMEDFLYAIEGAVWSVEIAEAAQP